MRKLILLIFIFSIIYLQCDIIDEQLKKRKEINDLKDFKKIYYPTMTYLLLNVEPSRNFIQPSCENSIVEITSLNGNSCANADIIDENFCETKSLKKNEIVFYKVLTTSNNNLRLIANDDAPSICPNTYKENTEVNLGTLISNLDSNELYYSCIRNINFQTSPNIYKCVSVYTKCDNTTLQLKITKQEQIFTVSGTGTDSLAIPNSWSKSLTSYTEITGTKTNLFGDIRLQAAPIGFNFTYFGKTYSNINIHIDGFLDFVFYQNSNSNFYDAKNQNDIGRKPILYKSKTINSKGNLVIAPWWVDLYADCQSNISYLTTGVSPNQIFTIQWKNILYDKLEKLNFQVKLYETSNKIEFIYGSRVNPLARRQGAIIHTGINNSLSGEGNYIDASNGSSTNGSELKNDNFPPNGTLVRMIP